MTRTLSRIQKMHGPVVPEDHWEMAGTTPQGQQLYIEKIPRTRAVPWYEDECDKCKNEGCASCRVWGVNQMTGERTYPKNKPEFYTQERMFFIESDGQFNQARVDWAPPTPEQIRALQHEKDVASMMPRLAGALVDSGLDIDEIVDRLTTPVPEPAPEPAPVEPLPFDASQGQNKEPSNYPPQIGGEPESEL